MSLFGACWTLGSLKYVLESQVESATYYETIGCLGIVDNPELPRYPDAFPAIEGSVFPMYHVFADLGELSDATILTGHSSHHHTVDVLSFRHDKTVTILLANLTPEIQTVTLNIYNGTYTMRRLNTQTALQAMTEPETYRTSQLEQLSINDNVNTLELLPYEYIRLQQMY